jgi:hypothetical protein
VASGERIAIQLVLSIYDRIERSRSRRVEIDEITYACSERQIAFFEDV